LSPVVPMSTMPAVFIFCTGTHPFPLEGMIKHSIIVNETPSSIAAFVQKIPPGKARCRLYQPASAF